MFSLISGFVQWLMSKTELQLLILGVDHAGKTTLLEQMKGVFDSGDRRQPLDKIPPTVGLNVGKMGIANCKVVFWDLGGQIGFRSIWDKYYSDAHGILFVVDSSDPERFEDARVAFDSIVSHRDLTGIPLLIMANKQDRSDALDIEKIADALGADDLTTTTGRLCRTQPVSALTCDGIEEGVTWLVEAAKDVPERQAAERNSRGGGRR